MKQINSNPSSPRRRRAGPPRSGSRVPAVFARRGEDVDGEIPRPVGGLACPGDVERNFAGAGGGLLHASRDLARRQILLFDGGGNRRGDAANLTDRVADDADRFYAIAGG